MPVKCVSAFKPLLSSLLPIFFGGGMRVVDLSVPALGFKAHDKQVFKVLATYDGLCNCTKIYVSSALTFYLFLDLQF